MLSLDNLKIDTTEKVFQPAKFSILRPTFYGDKPENFQSNVVLTSWAASKDLDQPEHLHNLPRAYTTGTHKV